MPKIEVRVLPVFSSIIMAWAVLLVLYILLRRLLYEPISKVLQERQDGVKSEIDEARELNKEAEELKLEYETRLKNAREESNQIMESARERGKELEASIVKDAREEANRIKERAKREIELERDSAFQELQAEAGEMAILIASKLIEEQMDLENQNQLIDQFIDEVGNAKWEN